MGDPLFDQEPRQLALLPPPLEAAPAALVPPVHASTWHRVPWLRVTVVLLAVALVGTGTWGYETGQNLARTEHDLATAKATINQDSSQIAALKTNLSAANSRSDDLAAQVTALQARVQNQDACIVALGKAGKLLSDVGTTEVQINNLTAKGSAWAKANDARDTALIAANNDYYNAYSAAWDGSYAAANSWVSKGNAQIDRANKDLDTMDAQIATANELQAEVTGMLQEYDASDLAVCGAPSSSTVPSG
jgi:septal ring factor EnvC (AmiA/AmiB activator)